MNIIKIDQKTKIEPIIKEVSERVKKGAVICYPTDTVYGLGANVYDKNSVEKIYRLKRREKTHPFTIIIGSVLELKEIISEMPKTACILIERFWPGALTIIFKSSKELKKNLPGKRETVGIRLPDSKICGLLTEYCGFPIISTSANLSGKKAPKSIEEIPQEIKSDCDIIVDAGEIHSSGESTVIDVSSYIPKIRRDGVIPIEEIQKYVNISKEI